jgi:hypothetical protein
VELTLTEYYHTFKPFRKPKIRDTIKGSTHSIQIKIDTETAKTETEAETASLECYEPLREDESKVVFLVEGNTVISINDL